MSFWRQLLNTISRNPISFFAVICVASAAYLLYIITDRLLDVLESPQWCGKAIQAEKISPGTTFKGLDSCLDLLKMQLSALGTGFHIALGAFAFSMIVLVVVVVAGARASGKVGSSGLEFDINRHDAPYPAAKAAEETAEAAVDKAQEIAAEGEEQPK